MLKYNINVKNHQLINFLNHLTFNPKLSTLNKKGSLSSPFNIVLIFKL